ncbi:conserved hypothetical protein [Burkholderia mallei 2002721280]|uniref:Uncharacterized protein n=1 Tax=Burkholderia mallei (strain NCTC 10229) TaxID=412022 RepID=A2S3H0_BURM9|nr:conserved hypothetical protein [Burkholderia mallei NCTC 10229]ABO04948.1 conserved hypothetical protein [Burkholderia mallei NCTC 10247]EDK60357.1 conserved hypothetical protein [Burkholderia mallei JHU]EDK85897.1 conserved hypothetical protein [Burkholderia mallei 2002721280]EDP88658.1 conserved hypothetical protein [Burkholderia mallei ATCC 10399]
MRPSARTLALDRPFAYVRAALSSRFFHGRRALSLVAGVFAWRRERGFESPLCA